MKSGIVTYLIRTIYVFRELKKRVVTENRHDKLKDLVDKPTEEFKYYTQELEETRSQRLLLVFVVFFRTYMTIYVVIKMMTLLNLSFKSKSNIDICLVLPN